MQSLSFLNSLKSVSFVVRLDNFDPFHVDTTKENKLVVSSLFFHATSVVSSYAEAVSDICLTLWLHLLKRQCFVHLL
jgi:hypothetical protein